jgi:hypothetical protein
MPTNDDERDFDEERFNADLLRNPDGRPEELSMDCRICAPFDCDDPDIHLGVPSRYTPLANRGCHCGADRDGRDCMCFE